MRTSDARLPIVVTHEGGLAFAAQVRGHRVVVDQPARAGGDDLGPAPIELLGAVLGTCVALYCPAHNTLAHGADVSVEIDRVLELAVPGSVT